MGSLTFHLGLGGGELNDSEGKACEKLLGFVLAADGNRAQMRAR